MAASAPAPSPVLEAPDYIRKFEDRAFGLFIHYGLYSLAERGEWHMHWHNIPREDYARYVERFTASGFDARKLVRTAKEAGMRYICLGTRHHEGFSLYDTCGLNTFDAPHSPAGRDLVREFSDACDEEGMGKFFYHTTLDWKVDSFDNDWEGYLRYLNDSVEILCTRYGRVDGLWFDGNWSRRDRDWKEDALYSLIRKHQPEAIIVNNSSTGAPGQIGHPMVDVATFEQASAGALKEGRTRYVAKERCETFACHWGVSKRDYEYKSPAEIIRILTECRGMGCNLLLNIGPEADGSIPAYEAASLAIVGRWIRTCGESLYEGRPAQVSVRGRDFVLEAPGGYYYFAHGIEIDKFLTVHKGEYGSGLKTVQGELPPVKRVCWVDNGEELAFSQDRAKGMFTFQATRHPYGEQYVVRVARLEV